MELPVLTKLFLFVAGLYIQGCVKPSSSTQATTSTPHGLTASTTRTVIFGKGPETFVRPSTVPKLRQYFNRDFPQDSQFVSLEKFSLKNLPKLDLQPGAKVHVILNAHGKVEQGEHWVYTEDGWLRTTELGKKLESLYHTKDSISVETSLITCYAGATDCQFFPGGVFGASSDKSVAYEYTFFHFIQGLSENRYRFPMSASEMYQGFSIASRAAQMRTGDQAKPITVWRQNCNGILGVKAEKTKSQPVREPKGLQSSSISATCYPLPSQNNPPKNCL